MATDGPKITYIAAQFRVRVELSRADCLASELPPPHLLERAKDKLRAERDAGRVAFYRIFKTRLQRTWDALRAADLPESTRVGVTVVTGAPHLPGIEVHAGDDPLTALLTVSAPPAVVRSWRFRLFKLTVGKYLRRMGIKTVLDAAHLEALWRRAGSGEPIERTPLGFLGDLPARASGEAYQLVVARDARSVSLVVHDVRSLCNPAGLARLRDAIAAAARTLGAGNAAVYRTLTSQILVRLQSANRGPERYGIDLPFVALALIADPRPARRAPSARPPRSAAAARRAQRTLADYVGIEIAADAMHASVTRFDTALFGTALGSDPEDWAAFFTGHGIDGRAACTAEMVRLVQARQSLAGHPVAVGTLPRAAQEPLLMRASPPTFAMSAGDVSVRDAQQRGFVRDGELIAYFTCKLPAEPGYDVKGRPLAAPAPAFPAVSIGEGVCAHADGTFTALFDGVPEVANERIAVVRGLLIKGNVNLASGNVYFSGPVTIQGSVESGAMVEVDGDLVVLGLIQGGDVKVSGTLTVGGGIITNGDGRVRTGGDLAAKFVENSRIECGGSVTVQRSVIASHVLASGDVTVTQPGGVIAGGEVFAGGGLTCGNLGRAMGPRTVVVVGIDPRHARRLRLRRGRHARLAQYLEQQEALKRALDLRPAGRQAEAQRAAKAAVKDRIARAAALVGRLAQTVAELKIQDAAVHPATVTVTGTLSVNCAVSVAGSTVTIPGDLAGVAIVARPPGGAKLVPLSASDPSEAEAS